MSELAVTKVKKLVVENTGGMRIAGTAVPKAISAGADFLRKLGERAGSIARSHGRKTIMEEDLEAARRQLFPH